MFKQQTESCLVTWLLACCSVTLNLTKSNKEQVRPVNITLIVEILHSGCASNAGVLKLCSLNPQNDLSCSVSSVFSF